jgi:hypothetical protein
MYKGIEDEKGRMRSISSGNPMRPKLVQSGAYEGYIFCSKCDNEILGGLERYASNNLYRADYLAHSKKFQQIDLEENKGYILCSGLDYLKIKHFLLSLLWRVSISKDTHFEGIKLDARTEDLIRACIYHGRPMPPIVLPCVVGASDNPEAEKDHNFVVIENVGQGIMKLYINQFIYTFCTVAECLDETAARCTIQDDGTMVILKVSEVEWKQVRASIVQALVDASKDHPDV